MKFALLVFILYQFPKAFIRFVVSGECIFVAIEEMEASEAVITEKAVEAVDVDAGSFPQSGNPWGITDIARKILSYCDLTDLRATAALGVEFVRLARKQSVIWLSL